MIFFFWNEFHDNDIASARDFDSYSHTDPVAPKVQWDWDTISVNRTRRLAVRRHAAHVCKDFEVEINIL